MQQNHKYRFCSTHSSSFSKPAAYIAHNASRGKTPTWQPGGAHHTATCDTSEEGGRAIGTPKAVKEVLSQCNLTAAQLIPISQVVFFISMPQGQWLPTEHLEELSVNKLTWKKCWAYTVQNCLSWQFIQLLVILKVTHKRKVVVWG